MRALSLTCLLLLLAACGANKSESDDLQEALRSYNQMVRWSVYQNAAAFVAPAFRERWAESRANVNGVSVTGLGVEGVRPLDDKGEAFEVLVRIQWYRSPDQTLRDSVWRQEWRVVERAWKLVDERPARPDDLGKKAAGEGPSWP